MQPQIQGHNGGVWGKLEEKVRDWAGRCDTLYIVKAATIDKDEYICNQTDLEEMAQKEKPHKSLHFNGIVPKFFYMALLATTRKPTPIVPSVFGRPITTTVKASISPSKSYKIARV